MPDTTAASAYDVFISYSHHDADWVWSWLVPRLKAAGLSVCSDRESFAIGVPSLINMENAVFASRHTVLVMTPAYMQSEWANFEQILTQTQDPIGLRRRTLPILREPCDIPPRIAMLTYVDLREGADLEFGLKRLINAVRDAPGLQTADSVSVGGTPPVPPAVAPQPSLSPTARSYDMAAIRELLTAALNDQELSDLAYDHFRPVYDGFSAGMSRRQKIQNLLEYSDRQVQLERLLALVQERNPAQYARFEPRLFR